MQPEFARKKKKSAEDLSSHSVNSNKSETAPGVPHFLKSARSSPDDIGRVDTNAAPVRVVASNDQSERDADHLAEQSINRENHTRTELGEVSPGFSTVGQAQSSNITGSGDALPEAERIPFEKSMNADFAGVRIHHDTEAARAADSLNALAFTENRDIAFGAGQYQPHTNEGRRLLAHELAHVKQQTSGAVSGVQRQVKPETQSPPQEPASAEQTPAAAESPTNDFFMRDEVEMIRGRSTARFLQTSATVTAGVRALEKLKGVLLRVSEIYKVAYKGYEQAVKAAGKEAQNQQEYLDFFVGLGIGVSAGLLSEWLFVAEGASLTLEVVVEVGTELGEGLAGGGVKASGILDIVGKDLAPSRDLDPMVIELEIYKLLENLTGKMLALERYGESQFFINSAAEYTIGEIKSHVAGGEQEMSEGDLIDLIETLVFADQHSGILDKTLKQFGGKLDEIQSIMEAAPVQSVNEMEQDIWILWLSTIADSESDILDLDAIEDRLLSVGVIGPSSRLGVDFGWYTSEADELAALMAARAKALEVRSRVMELTRVK